MVISEIQLEEKSGGRRGHYRRFRPQAANEVEAAPVTGEPLIDPGSARVNS